MDSSPLNRFRLPAKTGSVSRSLPAVPTAGVQPKNSKPKGQNPFMIAQKSDSPEFKDTYGVNRPLEKPMFLGYRDDKPMHGGSKLFILY